MVHYKISASNHPGNLPGLATAARMTVLAPDDNPGGFHEAADYKSVNPRGVDWRGEK